MEYPGSVFTRGWRVALLVFFIAAFFVATPLTLLYSIGYHFDWRSGFLKQAGGLSIDEITPKSDVRVYLNDVKLSGGLPIRLKNITPRTYLLRLTAPGYYDWEKQVEVRNKETYYVKQVALLKKLPPRRLVDGASSLLSLSRDGRYLAYQREAKNRKEVWLFDTTTSSSQRLLSVSSNLAITLSWANTYPALAIEASDPTDHSLMVFDAARPDELVTASALLPKPLTKYQWADTSPALYLADTEQIYFMDLRAGELITVSPNNFLDWAVEKNQLWTLSTSTDASHAILTKDALGFSTRETLEAPGARELAAWHFVDVSDNIALISAGTGEPLFIRGNTTPTQVQAQNAVIGPTKNWWVLWNTSEIWTYAAGDTPRLLNRTGSRVLASVLLDEYNTLGIVWTTQITALSPYYSVATPLVSGSFTAAQSDPQRHILYMSGTINNLAGIWALNY